MGPGCLGTSNGAAGSETLKRSPHSSRGGRDCSVLGLTSEGPWEGAPVPDPAPLTLCLPVSTCFAHFPLLCRKSALPPLHTPFLEASVFPCEGCVRTGLGQQLLCIT